MFTNNLIAGAAGNQGGFYDFPIEQSLKFNDDDSSYLSWTPASAGDQRTWTFSTWVKRGQLGVERAIFSVGATSPEFALFFHTTDQIRIWADPANTGFYTNAVYRDTSAWYHIVLQSSNVSPYLRLYVNGDEVTSFSYDNRSSNNTGINSTSIHRLGAWYNGSLQYWDGYLAEVNFIDGQALDASSFGEFKSGVWIPKDPSGLTYGTNGFRLSFQNDTVSEGFNAVTFSSDGSAGSVSGLGFSPDFVWAKSRTNADGHELWDTVRGTSSTLFSNVTEAQDTSTGRIVSFDADGFSYGTNGNMQTAGNFVAWCWDAGSGSPVSNTDGSITSTVKANAAYGFSVVSYTGTGSNATVGHGLGTAPSMIIGKNRSASGNWRVWNNSLTGTQLLFLNTTASIGTDASVWNSTIPTSSVFSIGTDTAVNGSGNDIIFYCFADVAGYSKVGSYSGSGATGNAVTTGFKPAFVMVKRTDSTGSWVLWDDTRDTTNPNQYPLYPNLSNAESFEATDRNIQFDSNGFTLLDGNNDHNASGGTYIYLAFADTRDNAFWRDQSGNGNDWQPNNLTYQDSLPDSTTNNFAVLNPLKSDGATLSEGNAKVVIGTSGGRNATSTFAVSSGKWYAESVCTANTINSNGFGVTNVNRPNSTLPYTYSDGVIYEASTGQKYIDGTNTSYGATFTTGDVIGIALDLDNDEITFYKNGSSQGTITTKTFNGTYEFVLPNFTGSYTVTYVANFGQDSSFAGNKPAQGNTDDNGVGDFFYPVPSGHLALAASNLPSPVIDPAQDDVPSDYFNTVLYTGTGSARSITGVGFQPDLVWIKSRSDIDDHYAQDAVRGATKQLNPNKTNAETSFTNGVTSFDADGFSLGSSQWSNESGQTRVAWNWLAGNGTSSNTDGSITSTVSVNQKAGFSIVSYTGTQANGTVGHGLGAAPKVVISKSRTNANGWPTLHAPSGNYGLRLNETGANNATNGGFFFQNTAPTSSVFYVGANDENNTSGGSMIAYCFAEVEGYSKFGSYTGNGSTDGPFVYTGFRPALTIVKRTDAAGNSWRMHDDKRGFNGAIDRLHANLSNADVTGTTDLDILSNGFKVRTTSTDQNASGATYIYMAFAENPFKYANAR